MQRISTVSFALVPLSEDDHVLSIVPVVDEVLLTRLIDDFERECRFEPAGGYAGLVSSHFNFGPLDRYFMAADTTPTLVPDHRHLLGCKCGEVGCWPLEARILATERQVTWEGFRQPFRRERDYSSFGCFNFDLGQYRQAIHEMASAFAASSRSAPE